MVGRSFFAVELKHAGHGITDDYRIITRNEGRADVYLAQLMAFYRDKPVRLCWGCAHGECVWQIAMLDETLLGLPAGNHQIYFDVLYDEGIINGNIREVGLPDLTSVVNKERLNVAIAPHVRD